MSRSGKHSSSRVERARALPWAAVLQTAVLLGKRWRSLSANERERLRTLVAESGGRLGRLSAKERKELRKLGGKLDLKGLGRELLPVLRGGRGRRRGRRRGA
jgi:hypothetical protein